MAAPGPWREPSPYPPYPRNNAHSPPVPNRPHPYASTQTNSFYGASMQQPAVPGFYNPSLPQPQLQPQPPSPPGGGGAPAFPQPRIGLPPSLMPGRQPTFAIPRSQSNDFFFQSPSPTSYGPPRHSQTAPVPPLPRKPDFNVHPPLPPKPPLPSSPPTSHSHPVAHPEQSNGEGTLFASPEPSPGPSAPPFPLSDQREEEDDDAILNRVLEMSAQESRPPAGPPTLSEEEQIARAMEESLRIGRSQRHSVPGRELRLTSSPEQSSSNLPAPSKYAPDIIVEQATGAGSGSGGGRGDRVSATSHLASQISADEVLARQLAEEEERLLEEERSQDERSHSRSPSAVREVEVSPPEGLPKYEEAVSSPPPPTSQSLYGNTLTTHFPTNGSSPEGSQSGSPTQGSSLYRSVSDKPLPPKATAPVDQGKPLSRSQSLGEGTPLATASLTPPTPQAPRSQGSRPLSVASSALGSIEESKPNSPVSTSTSSPGVEVASNTQYLDAELLAGLSLGFGTPSITHSLKPFEGVIPNVIALPYGRCPPFHIRAPSWRTLLKLMARLSGTRLEPTMEAIAVVKTEMRLRVVVSFVKVHQASNDWYTVLYMTIDHPVPPNAPTGWKYRNGDPNTLPFSYTLSQLPAFLRDGADAPLSKFYTIPGTQEMPFPVLPISFPNLATYLASALEISRGSMHDSSSGVRRLAKCVDQYYPNDRIMSEDAQERTGMRWRLKSLVGIGHRPQRDRNAEVYELVTPFVADEFGR